RDIAFCDPTIRQSAVLVVPDATKDPRFRDNPVVTGEPGVRFYAGAPLISSDGYRLGSLCILDFEPRETFTQVERQQLEAMAGAVSVTMNMRRDVNALRDAEQQLLATDARLRANEAQLSFLLEHSADVLLRIAPDATITWASPSVSHYGYTVEELIGTRTNLLVHPDDRSKLSSRRASRFATLQDPSERHEYRVLRKDGDYTWIEESPTIIRDAAGQAIEMVNLLRDISDRKKAENAASDIQTGMLLPREALARVSPRVEIDAVLQPARSVGGDLYDAFMIDARRLCFVLGDVTGKGMAASLFMALSKALSHSLLTRYPDDLAAAFSGIGAELSRNNGESMALAMLAGVLDLETGRLQLCNAGHDDPMIVTADGEVQDLRLEGGPPLCATVDYQYCVEFHDLPPGAALVAVTDGVTEAQDARGDLFGREGAHAALAAVSAGAPLTELIDALVA
ncbi:MAG: SpoIIE family protein phosphatase, partial [Dehalococcoidia bacterium]|nr:SpoIIE family protein phosphatase [Dehalococcoidia bacterium]